LTELDETAWFHDYAYGVRMDKGEKPHFPLGMGGLEADSIFLDQIDHLKGWKAGSAKLFFRGKQYIDW
jgi:hypothetical protein